MAECKLCLLCDNLVSLAKDVSAFTVSQDDPVDFSVHEHLGTEFSSVGTIIIKRGILSGYLKMAALKCLLHSGDVDCGWCYNNFDLGWVEDEGFEDISWELLGKVKSAIAFPVSTDKVLSHNL